MYCSVNVRAYVCIIPKKAFKSFKTSRDDIEYKGVYKDVCIDL